MNTARQILRFSIPGSIFLLHAVGCYLLSRCFQGISFATASEHIGASVTPIIAVLAAIPVGFVIYQIYYFSYEPVLRIRPLPWRGRLVRRDRGGQILKTLDPGQIDMLEKVFAREINTDAHSVVPSGKSPLGKLMHASGVLEVSGDNRHLPLEGKKRQLAYEHLWYTNWDVLRSLVDIAGSSPECEQIKVEYTNLSDIYHSLGAARTAVISAWVAVCVFSISHIGRLSDNLWESIGGLVVISGLTLGLYFVFYVARGRTWRSAEASLSFGLRWFHWRHGDKLLQSGVGQGPQ
jgi:hypothetical protein